VFARSSWGPRLPHADISRRPRPPADGGAAYARLPPAARYRSATSLLPAARRTTPIEVAIGPAGAPGMFKVELVASRRRQAPAAVKLDADSLLARRGLLQQAVLAPAVPSRRVLPETEQPVREVGLLRVVRERRVAELVQRGTAVAANILMTVYAADIAQPLTAGWHGFQQAVGDDTVGWDMASASAHVWPGALDRAVAGGPGTPWPGDARLFHRGPDG